MDMATVLSLLAMLISFGAATVAFIYGLRLFFKKRIPLCLQSITMAMGCHALGSLYRICYSISNSGPLPGFTPAHLGYIGFFLFFITASYGQMDKIVDDGSAAMRPSRYLSLPVPALAMLLLPSALTQEASLTGKITCSVIWVLASVSVYFNTKHALIPDMDFIFIKALKPYNILSVALSFAQLLCLCVRQPVLALLASALFGALSIALMAAAKKGVKQWTI